MEGPSIIYDTNITNSPGFEITGKIMVSVLVILFFSIILFIFLFLHFHSYFSSRRQQTPTSRRRHLVFAATGHSAAAAHCRLDPSVLNSIPVLTFGSKDEEMDCAVCLSEIVERENIRILPKCNHGFHVECIDMWFLSNSTCPICRNLVSDKPELKMEDEENPAIFPTNILVWGNQDEVTSITLNSEEQLSPASSSFSSSSSNIRLDDMLVIDIPRHIEDEENKSPVMEKLKSFKRLLSRNASRLVPSSSTGPGKLGSEQC